MMQQNQSIYVKIPIKWPSYNNSAVKAKTTLIGIMVALKIPEGRPFSRDFCAFHAGLMHHQG
jgi:hypothetical protein